LPASYEMVFTSAHIALLVGEKGGAFTDDVDDEELERYKISKKVGERVQAAEGFRAVVTERIGVDGEFKACPTMNGGSVEASTEYFHPLMFEGSDGAKVACDECVVYLSIDTAGCVSSKIARDRTPIAVRQKSDASASWFWYKFIAVLVLVFCAISYRTYTVTHVFSYNTRKLHRFYQFEVKKKINSIQEARYIVYTYQDKEERLWEKLERKYGIKVQEPSFYNDLVIAEEEAAYENAEEIPEEGQDGWGADVRDDEDEEGEKKGKKPATGDEEL